MPYSPTYLRFFYETFPDMLTKPKNDNTGCPESAKPQESEESPANDVSTPDKPDILPDFPHLRLSRAAVMKFFTVNSDALIEMGPKSGMYKAQQQQQQGPV